MNWIDQVVHSTAESESPARFQYWAAMAAISATVKRNVYLDRYYYKLYPNIYVFIVGKSGLRKGNPVTLARTLVRDANVTRLVAGRGSIQAILKDLGRAHSIPGGGVMKDASAMVVSGELGALFVKDPDALTILTDLYDTHAHDPEWKNSLKSGVDVLHKPCITLLGATNEEHFKDAVPPNQIGGGFMARTIVVLENQRRNINDLLDPPLITPDHKSLAYYLTELSKVSGVFAPLVGNAKELYRAWYKELSVEHTFDKTGTLERIGDTVLKVAMNLSLAESHELIIKEHHVKEAIQEVEICQPGLKVVTMGAGSQTMAGQTALLLKEFLRKPENKMTRKQILNKFWGELDALDLDRIMETLIQSGAVNASNPGGVVTYQMTKSAVEAYSKFKKEVN